MRTDIVVNKIDEIRSCPGEKYTNIYTPVASAGRDDWDAITSEHTICLLYTEGSASRVQFMSSDRNELCQVLNQLGEDTTIDIIGRDTEQLSDIMTEGGFSVLARMQRWANKDISGVMEDKSPMRLRYGESDPGIVATEDDASDILAIYRKVFDTRVSHLPTIEELKKSIRNKEVIIHKDNDDIHTILQCTIELRRFYIHQVFNDGMKSWLHGIIFNELEKYYKLGGRYMYAWVQDTNIASQRMHAKYGMKPDGLWDMVYTKI